MDTTEKQNGKSNLKRLVTVRFSEEDFQLHWKVVEKESKFKTIPDYIRFALDKLPHLTIQAEIYQKHIKELEEDAIVMKLLRIEAEKSNAQLQEKINVSEDFRGAFNDLNEEHKEVVAFAYAPLTQHIWMRIKKWFT